MADSLLRIVIDAQTDLSEYDPLDRNAPDSPEHRQALVQALQDDLLDALVPAELDKITHIEVTLREIG